MSTTSSSLRVRVDPTNPGQFFACCGLLELADRAWGGAEGWFDSKNSHHAFVLKPINGHGDAPVSQLAAALSSCHLANTMTPAELLRRAELGRMKKKEREEIPSLCDEKEDLDRKWREAPIALGDPFGIVVDWFLDDRAGGSRLKTWAGQQSVMDIAREMKSLADSAPWDAPAEADWLNMAVHSGSLPFNFDCSLGAMGADRDVGFSFDPLRGANVNMDLRIRPRTELLAFIGLQRFRPRPVERRYRITMWFDPLTPEVASAVVCGLVDRRASRTLEFGLLYRTKYLKSFLPATFVGEDR